MSGRNCKLIVVKPEKRGGYMPSQVMTRARKEAKRRGIQIDERIHAP
jgi:LDH2 family malate/lactate/ureidoglycolate dehydrogenase